MLILAVNWTALSAVATAIAATAAAVSLIQFRGQHYRKLLSDRPRFRLTDPGVKKDGETDEKFKVGMNNYGGRTAENVVVDVAIVDEDLETTLTTGTHTLFNDIPPSDQAHPWWGELSQPPDHLSRHYVYFGLRYRDGFQGRQYIQKWFLAWEGIEDGEVSRSFRHIKDPDEAERLERHFRERIDALTSQSQPHRPFGWTLGAGVPASILQAFRNDDGWP